MRQIWRAPRVPALAGRRRRRSRRLLPPGLDVDLFDGVAYVGIVPFTIPLTRAAALGAPHGARVPRDQPAHVRPPRRPRPGRLVLQPRRRPAGSRSRARASPTGCRTSPPTSRWSDDGSRDGPRAPSTTAAAAADRRRRSAGATCRPGRSPRPRRARSSSSWPSATCCTRGRRGALRTARVHHAPYPLQPAAAGDVAQTLTYVAGLPPGGVPGPPPLVHYARERRRRDLRPRRLDNARAVR